MRSFILIIVLWSCIACNRTREGAQDALNSTMEKAIEARTGTKVDLGDAGSYEDNNGSVSFIADNKTYLSKEEKLQAVALFQKEKEGLAISFQLSGQEGKSFIVIVNHIPDNFSIPLRARFSVSNSYDGINPVATLMFMEAEGNGMLSSPIPFEGSLIITRLTEKEMSFEVDAKGAGPEDTDSPSEWKPIKVLGTLQAPIIQSIGIDKKDVLK